MLNYGPWMFPLLLWILSLGFSYSNLTEADSVRVLAEGPWHFRGDILQLIPRCPNFQPITTTINTAPIFIHLSRLPIEY